MAGLDPENWEELRTLGHRMLDDMLESIKNVAKGPVWQPMPDTLRQGFKQAPLPQGAQPLDGLYDQFSQAVAPYAVGNRHPRFMGWVHGGGTAQGMLAEMLAAGLTPIWVAVTMLRLKWSAWLSAGRRKCSAFQIQQAVCWLPVLPWPILLPF